MLKKILNKIFNPFIESDENYKKYIDKLLKKILKYPILSDKKFNKIFFNPSVNKYLDSYHIGVHNYNDEYYFVCCAKKRWYIIPSYYKIKKFKLTKRQVILIHLYYLENEIRIRKGLFPKIVNNELLLRRIKLEKLMKNIL